MSSAFLSDLVHFMRANGETEATVEIDGQAVQIELKPAAKAQPEVPRVSSSECASCRANLRLWSVLLAQPLGRN